MYIRVCTHTEIILSGLLASAHRKLVRSENISGRLFYTYRRMHKRIHLLNVDGSRPTQVGGFVFDRSSSDRLSSGPLNPGLDSDLKCIPEAGDTRPSHV